MTEREIDELEEQIPEMVKIAISNAHKEALESGLVVTIAENGYIWHVYPDGSRKMIKKLPEVVKVEKGSVIQIR